MAITLHQIRIFWAVAQARSFTKASKLLGLAQPSLSQQIAKLEEEIGTQLFIRGHANMTLTEAGSFLKKKSEVIISNVDEASLGLSEYGSGKRGILSVGSLSSVARNIMPEAINILKNDFPNYEIDILEVAPAEAIDLLYSRRLSIAILASDSVASSQLSFKKQNIFSDPYVLAVPKNINLNSISGQEELETKQKKVLGSIIEFEFGNQHKRRIEEWVSEVISKPKVVARTRTYEVALSMVQHGLGIAVLPALTASIGNGRGYEVNLYKTNLPARKVVALSPSQYARVEPYKSFISSLEKAGSNIELPKIWSMPKYFDGLGANK